ncbi:expressed unknown protein [Seminavis robusta]|uniref:Uncharacterized protein n=1 Tax=Seminavis robusta TaxID=568900 RepID=A0A9N8DUQ3_9STRA|nr:expressed unknown protein [Seminavis robusta]|eukprot:Sro386_g131820.1 n/a (708) ;mRNA; r:8829-10952
MDRLHELNDKVAALELAQQVSEWAEKTDDRPESFVLAAQNVIDLANILCQHEDSQSSLYRNLYDREYQPLHAHVRSHLILQLRNMLLKAGYPSAEGCGALLTNDALGQVCQALTQLQATNFKLANHTHKTSVSANSTPWSSGETCDVLVEFFRPIVERVRFHFVEFHADRPTSSKMERLPEILLTYLQEHVIEGKSTTGNNNNNSSSPWELVTLGLAPFVTEEMPSLFLNELVGLAQYVLGPERNFFRDHRIAGRESNPMLLCNAIEQLLQFDDALRNLLPMGQSDRLVRLMDIFVAGDEELLGWWLIREKEMVFATLFDDSSKNDDDDEHATKLAALVKSRISPRAELFCALIRSVQVKASVFSFSGPYLNAVAVPLCMQFLDAVHESSTDLKKALTSPSTRLQFLADDKFLAKILEDWMAVINGTRLAAAILTRDNPWAQQSMAPSANSSVNDLARFGRSLEQLQNVLVEEFALTFVETFLMERRKLAAYLMGCSHFLSHSMEEDDEEEEDDGDISFILKPTLNAMSIFLQLCSDCDREDGDEDEGQNFASFFAPRVMRAKVIPMIANKFLEVALDWQGLSVGIILPEGAVIFERDVLALFEDLSSWKEVERLLDVAKLMNMHLKPLEGLHSALMGLIGGPEDPTRPWLLHSHQFTQDAALFDQAICMLRAKGFSLDLEDALSVLNRRKDLMEHLRKAEWLATVD